MGDCVFWNTKWDTTRLLDLQSPHVRSCTSCDPLTSRINKSKWFQVLSLPLGSQQLARIVLLWMCWGKNKAQWKYLWLWILWQNMQSNNAEMEETVLKHRNNIIQGGVQYTLFYMYIYSQSLLFLLTSLFFRHSYYYSQSSRSGFMWKHLLCVYWAT